MRLRAADGTALHLAYCTNVHPADEAEGVIAQIDTFARPVREALGADRLGLGLWLSAAAARTLRHHTGTRLRLKAALRDAGCEVVTVNAFPYGAFQAPVVKQAVYHPDWTTPERLGYTVDAAWVLADLLPDDVARGSISTLPLAWRTPWDQTRAAAGRAHLQQLAEELGRIEDESGRTIRVGLEPEPGCLVETVEEAATALAGLGTDRIGVCLDLCHLATGFTTAQDALTVLREAGLPVVKAQVSAALHAQDPAASQGALRSFSEDRFLHQVRRRTAPGWDDLPEALAQVAPSSGTAATGAPADEEAWRVHFHLPLHAQPADPGLRGTQDELRASLAALVGEVAHTDHLEVESYTWSVLPAAQRPTTDAQLSRGIAAELDWAVDTLASLGAHRTEAVIA